MNDLGITELDYMRVEAFRKDSLARLIKKSGLSYNTIAKATGVERRAVRRAAECEGIRYDTATRLEYYLELYNQQAKK